MATVTALRERRGLVAIELDGGPWRTVPVIVAAEARLTVGCALERERARALARALRRYRARETAVRAIARRDHSRASLDARLERAGVRGRAARGDRGRREGRARRRRTLRGVPRAPPRRSAAQATCSLLDDLERHGVDAATAGPSWRRSSRRPSARGTDRRRRRGASAGRSGSRRGGSRRSRSRRSLRTCEGER